MPRKPNDHPTLRRHPNGQATVSMSGEKHYLGRWGSPEASNAFARALLEWQRGGKQPLPKTLVQRIVAESRGERWGDSPTVTMKSIADAYLRDCAARRLDPAHINTVRLALSVMTDLFGAMPADDFSPGRLREVRARFVQDGLARVEANRRTAIVRRAYRFAGENDWVADGRKLDVVRGLRPGEGGRETGRIGPVSDEAVEATLPHLSPIVADMVRVQRATAMRPGEVCGMTLGEIDRGGEIWWYTPGAHKTAKYGKTRAIPIGPRGQAVLLRYLGRPDAAPIFSPKETVRSMHNERAARRVTPQSCGNVVGSNRVADPRKKPSDRYDTRAYGRAVRLAAKRAGVAPWSPNRLRHAALTAIDHAFGPREAQLLGGHSTARMTAHYVQADLTRLAEVARQVG